MLHAVVLTESIRHALLLESVCHQQFVDEKLQKCEFSNGGKKSRETYHLKELERIVPTMLDYAHINVFELEDRFAKSKRNIAASKLQGPRKMDG